MRQLLLGVILLGISNALAAAPLMAGPWAFTSKKNPAEKTINYTLTRGVHTRTHFYIVQFKCDLIPHWGQRLTLRIATYDNQNPPRGDTPYYDLSGQTPVVHTRMRIGMHGPFDEPWSEANHSNVVDKWLSHGAPAINWIVDTAKRGGGYAVSGIFPEDSFVINLDAKNHAFHKFLTSCSLTQEFM